MNIITSNQLLHFHHHHTPDGRPIHLFEHTQVTLQNPLYRSCLETFLSYVPLLSVFTGVHALLGISSLKYSLEIRLQGIGTLCPLSPCVEINANIASIRKAAWLEIFGIKGLFVICHLVIRVVRFFLAYCMQTLGILPYQYLVKSPQEEIFDLIS